MTITFIFHRMTENNSPQDVLERIDVVFDKVLPRLDPVSGESALLRWIFLSGGQFCIFFSKLERDIDLILFLS